LTAADVLDTRTRLGLTQVQLANLIGVHPLTVSKWERGVLAPSPHQDALLGSFQTAVRSKNDIGEAVAGLLMTAGVALALFALLQAAFGKEK
jgi:transcriptional regulator with XRE-family HTH domain